MQITKTKNKETGLTLVEAIVSFFILTSAIIGSFVLVQKNLAIASIIKNEVIATQLAEEGIEVIRNLRDGDWHSGRVFGTSIPDGTFLVQWDSTALLPNSSDFLKLNSSNGLYDYNSIGTDTLFQRSIVISTNSGESGIRKIITVNVSWIERGGNKLIQAEEHLFNWK